MANADTDASATAHKIPTNRTFRKQRERLTSKVQIYKMYQACQWNKQTDNQQLDSQ